ncbi:hypothetical protein CJU90_2539 [Yarrowia sp. C11]|nr:hypothetical protein CJU90_2539 [Yarrowia sp. C11]
MSRNFSYPRESHSSGSPDGIIRVSQPLGGLHHEDPTRAIQQQTRAIQQHTRDIRQQAQQQTRDLLQQIQQQTQNIQLQNQQPTWNIVQPFHGHSMQQDFDSYQVNGSAQRQENQSEEHGSVQAVRATSSPVDGYNTPYDLSISSVQYQPEEQMESELGPPPTYEQSISHLQ